jgi:predicted P-loop ATPase
VPRQVTIVGTTNEFQFLAPGATALARRFWPIAVEKKIDIAWVEKSLDQIWAAAVALEKTGYQIYFDDDSKLDKSAFTEAEDEMVENARAILEHSKKESITVQSLWLQASGTDKGMPDRAAQMQLARVLKEAGWTKKHTRKGNEWSNPKYQKADGNVIKLNPEQ